MKVAIVGCGLIGKKRAQSLPADQVRWLIDKRIEAARDLAKAYPGAQTDTDWQKAFSDPSVGLVVVATAHRDLAPLTKAAVESGKHVLVEKPAGVSAAELKPILDIARARRLVVKVGFNHRYHPSFLKCREIVDSGELGKVMFIRAKYGHGARVGYEKEWRAQKELSGGGELIDQGMHLIDLSRWFLGEFSHVSGFVPTMFWKMDVEDNCFLDLRTSAGQIAWLHAGWTEWKNVFCFEIMGQHGKLQVDGLGGSYGTERLTHYKMLPQMGPPETTTWEYPFADRSWELEMKDLLRAIETGTQPMANIQDGYEALRIVDKVYQQESK